MSSPTAVKCQVSVGNSVANSVPSGGGSGTLSVTTTRDCTWDASSGAAWITLMSGTSGQGSGSVSYRVSANADPAQRRGIVDVNNTQITVVQDAAPCRFTLTPASTTVSASGGTVAVTVDTLSGCSWTAASQAAWITMAGAASGTTSGSVTVSVAANTGGDRSGTVTIGGQTVTIAQPAPVACDVTPTPASISAAASAGTGAIAVASPGGCRWTATSSVDWIVITGGAAGTGNGQVEFSFTDNSSTSSRQGAIVIGGHAVAFTQVGAAAPPPPPPPPAPTCTFTIAPASQSVADTAGSGSIAVTASASTCAWTATTTAGWITFSSAVSGSGSGTVAFSVGANTGAARSGTIVVGGQTFTVNQAAPPPPCTFGIAPASQSVADAGGGGSIAVTASAPTCTWTAAASAGWITITGGASGTGNGTVAFTVAANTGAARSGSIAIGGQTFAVNQAAPPPPCTFSIAPTSTTVAAAGASGTVAVTASAASCTWTAASTAGWITVTSGASGMGNGTVAFTVGANTGSERNGSITIAGKTFDVRQRAQ